MPIGTAREAGPLAVAAVAGVAHLLIGYIYLVSGLAVPGYALIPLWVWWFVLSGLLVRLAVRRSWWSAAIPFVATATWVLVVLGGGELLGWTA
jgi:hypothetical protein